MATPRRYLFDGTIEGRIAANRQKCDNCQSLVWCIEVMDVRLPEGVKPSVKLITYHTVDGPNESMLAHVDLIGLDCGCYARAHRQMVHIRKKEG